MDNKFEKFYNNIISSNEDLTRKSNKISKKTKILNIIFFPILIFFIVIAIIYKQLMIMFAFIPIFIAYLIILTLIRSLGNIDNEYKEKVILPLIKLIYEDALYDPTKGLSKEDYNSKLYNEHYDRFSSQDYVQCDNKKIIFSEVLTEDREEDSEGNEDFSTIFNGIAGKKTLNKSINETFKVLKNNLLEKSKINLDNTEFEKKYDVICSNDILALRILTPDVMVDILDLQNNYDVIFEFCIINNILYFRFSNNFNAFEIDNINDIYNKNDLLRNYNLLEKIEKITSFIEKVIIDIEL